MKKQRKLTLVLTIITVFILTALCLPAVLSAQRPSQGPVLEALDRIPPTWSRKLQCDSTACPRFELVLDDAAVLDHETGLVWEQSPSSTNTHTWVQAHGECYLKELGGRKGWHLPTIEQLASLVDPTIAFPGPTLPVGHPFTAVQSTDYWSASTVAGDAALAWGVDFSDGSVRPGGGKTRDGPYVWCVRGGQSHDAY